MSFLRVWMLCFFIVDDLRQSNYLIVNHNQRDTSSINDTKETLKEVIELCF